MRFGVFLEADRFNLAFPGSSQYLATPMPAKPLSFDLHLDTPAYDDAETTARLEDSDSRLMEMLAAQAHHREGATLAEDEDSVSMDEKLSVDEKKDILQKSLNMAASNGDVERVRRLVGGRAKEYVDVNTPDDEGTVPLIYASCFVGLILVPVGSAHSVLRLSRRGTKMWF